MYMYVEQAFCKYMYCIAPKGPNKVETDITPEKNNFLWNMNVPGSNKVQ